MNSYRRNGGRKNNNRFFDFLREQLKQSPKPLWSLFVFDILLLVISLLVFALFHHVIPRGGVAVEAPNLNRISAVETAVAPLADAATDSSDMPAFNDVTPEIAAAVTPVPTAEPVGSFGSKFADKFTSGEVIATDTSYQSSNVNITVTAYNENRVQFYVEDIYIKDISCLQTGFAQNTFGFGYSEWPIEIASRLGAIAAINGDYYGLRKDGLVIRNGVLYLDCEFPMRDVCVLYADGSMKTYPSTIFDGEAEMAKGAWQAWNFGPMLLDENGETKTSFNTDVSKINPRTAIGYYEPGHYCFVTVDGRSEDSSGVTMEDFSKLMRNLGCSVAYNLDGGKTSQMVFRNTLVNEPCDGGRQCSDAIMILDISGST